MTQSSDIHTAIAKINKMFREIVENGNEAGTGALFAKAGLSIPENGDFESNQENIQSFWQSVMDLGIKEAKLENLEVEGNSKTTIEVSADEQTSTISKRDFGLIWD